MKFLRKCRKPLALMLMCCMMLTSFGVNAFSSDVAKDTISLAETTYTESGLKDGDDAITLESMQTDVTLTKMVRRQVLTFMQLVHTQAVVHLQDTLSI